MTVAIVDYGAGNLGSVCRAIRQVGGQSFVLTQPSEVASADHVILPGVGHFETAMHRLAERGWVEALHEVAAQGVPLLGICLGMQLLAERSSETLDGTGYVSGLGLVAGTILRLDQIGCTERIPHTGWNSVNHGTTSTLFAGIPSGIDMYFVHSYAFAPGTSSVIATTDYGVELVVSVQQENVLGTQFHPEKSSRGGLELLRNFLSLRKC